MKQKVGVGNNHARYLDSQSFMGLGCPFHLENDSQRITSQYARGSVTLIGVRGLQRRSPIRPDTKLDPGDRLGRKGTGRRVTIGASGVQL